MRSPITSSGPVAPPLMPIRDRRTAAIHRSPWHSFRRGGGGKRGCGGEAVRVRAEYCFRFKAIASVIAKGMTTETRVYELVDATA